jgi:hypothetical protein
MSARGTGRPDSRNRPRVVEIRQETRGDKRISGLPRKIAFIHIRKTAGSTLFDAISRNYSADQQLLIDGRPHNRDEVTRSLADLGRKPVRLIYGHVGFGVAKYLPSDFSMITILRDPMERVLSQYYFLRGRKKSPDSYYQKHSLEYALSDSEVNHYFSNVQTRVLSSAEVQISQKPVADMGQQDLEAALGNLKRLSLVGFTEQFSSMLAELSSRFHLKTDEFTVQKRNRSRPSVAEVPTTTRKLIARANELDQELYDAARKIIRASAPRQRRLPRR